jgi:hypothetical protein
MKNLRETYRITPARRNLLDRLADVAAAPFTVERDIPLEKDVHQDVHQALYGNPTPSDMRRAEFRKTQLAARLSRIDAIRDMGLPADKRWPRDTDRMLKAKMAAGRSIEKREPISEVLQPKARVPKVHRQEKWKWNGFGSTYHDPKLGIHTHFNGHGNDKGAGMVYVSFTVGGSHKRQDSGRRDRTKVLARVLDHVNHFVKTYKPSHLVYETDSEKKERLYRKVGARLGVPVIPSKWPNDPD